MKKLFSISFLIIYVLLTAGMLAGCDLDWLKKRQETQPNIRFFANSIIAHAGGGLGINTYLNSEEGLEHYYAKGTRLFEYDFAFSSDGHLIGIHNWETLLVGSGYSFNNRMSLAQYENKKIAGKYTGMTFANLLVYMEQYEDISIILDTKEEDELSVYQEIVNVTSSYNPDLLPRIIPQLYSRAMYTQLEAIHPFNQYIYTLYKSEDTNEQVYNFLRDTSKVKILTVSAKRIRSMDAAYVESIYQLNRRVFIHTIDAFYDMDIYRKKGVEGFYSNYVSQEDYHDRYNNQ